MKKKLKKREKGKSDKLNFTSLWRIIAKNELKIRTNRFRNHRPLFFVILYSILVIWAFILSPLLFNIFMPTLVVQIPGILNGIALIIELGLMAIFLSIFMYPLNNIYRKTEIGYKEILLASPATVGDIFLGEFIGKFPIYLGAVLVITPIVIGLLNPVINLIFIQYLIIYACIFGIVVFATLLGSITAAWLEHKIAKSERAKDLGKVLLFLISIAMVAIIFSMQFLFNFLINNPQLKNWVIFFPSLWFSNILLFFIEPSLVNNYFLNVGTSTILAVIVPFLILFIAYKKAEKFYTVDGSIEKISTSVKKENILYSIMRKLIGHKWEGLIITQFKEFFRKRENLMKIVYLIGIEGMIGFFFSFTLGGSEIIGQFYIKSLIIVFLIFIGGTLYGVMFGSYIFVGSKELLWLYKKSPRNISVLIYSYIFTMLILNLFFTLGLTIFFALFFKFDIIDIIFFFSFYLINSMTVISQAIGIQSINPSFEEKGRVMSTNIITLVLVQMVPFQLLFMVLLLVSPPFTSALFAKLYYLSPLLLISISISLPLLYFGIKKLSKIE